MVWLQIIFYMCTCETFFPSTKTMRKKYSRNWECYALYLTFVLPFHRSSHERCGAGDSPACFEILMDLRFWFCKSCNLLRMLLLSCYSDEPCAQKCDCIRTWMKWVENYDRCDCLFGTNGWSRNTLIEKDIYIYISFYCTIINSKKIVQFRNAE